MKKIEVVVYGATIVLCDPSINTVCGVCEHNKPALIIADVNTWDDPVSICFDCLLTAIAKEKA